MPLYNPAGSTPADGSVTRAKVHADTIKTARVSTGLVAAAATVEVAVTWATAFPNANYTVNPSVEETTAGESNLRVRKIVSRAAAAIVVRITNDDAISARTGTIHAVGIGD